MANNETIAVLFDPEPELWGLRGDPYAWRALKKHLAKVEFPASPNEAKVLLRAGFDEVVGVKLYAPDSPAKVERPEWNHGGMSGGVVDLTIWRTKLMPLLEEHMARHLSR